MTSAYVETEHLLRRLRTTAVRGSGPQLPDLELLKLSGPFTSVEEFLETGLSSFGELLHMTSLHRDAHVLDYGCGLGRLAIPFSLYLDGGAYVGIDTNRQSLDHCKEALAEQDNVLFHFVDIFSTAYNPTGKPYSELASVPYKDAFDLAFLYSVFTHVLPGDLDRLITYLYDALKPGGELFASFFLLNQRSLGQIEAGKAHRGFSFEHDGARIDNQDVPEGAVAYQEEHIVERLAAVGFEDPYLSYGQWSGSPPQRFHPHHQDIVIAQKPARRSTRAIWNRSRASS